MIVGSNYSLMAVMIIVQVPVIVKKISCNPVTVAVLVEHVFNKLAKAATIVGQVSNDSVTTATPRLLNANANF